MNDRSRCAVLVPIGTHVEQACEVGLRALEAAGYAVRRLHGSSAVDMARNKLATEALDEGFDELMWIDADVAFVPDYVDALRAHDKPLVCGLYPKKTARELAAFLPPGLDKLVFGKKGGLIEIVYAGMGFVYTRREVYTAIERELGLPRCNARFGRTVVPYFLPLVVPDGDGHWYLGEDFAFQERARRAGYPLWADTTLRLSHVGTYGYSWEDLGNPLPRYATYNVRLGAAPAAPTTETGAPPDPPNRAPQQAPSPGALATGIADPGAAAAERKGCQD